MIVEMDNPIAPIVQVGNRIYLHQAMKEPDKAHFLKLRKSSYMENLSIGKYNQ